MSLEQRPIRLSVVVPAWKAAGILAPHLPRLVDEAEAFPGGAEVIVVDDASEEGLPPLESLMRRTPGPVRLVRRDTHAGFAVTANVGARSAQGEFLLFLNDDMHVEPGCFRAVIEVLERREDVFAVSPIVVNLESGFPESSIRTRFHRGVFDQVFPGRSGTAAPKQGSLRRIAYACGGALACRRSVFLKLGGFPEMLSPVYWEDAGLSWIARRYGFEVLETGAGRILHDHARTVSAELTPHQVSQYYEKNRLLFTWVHLAGWRAWSSHLAWMPLRLGASFLRGGVLLHALAQALGSVGGVRRARAALASTGSRAHELLREVQSGCRSGWPNEPDFTPAFDNDRGISG